MEYIGFSVWFMVIHCAAYVLAGVFALKISKDLYEGKNRKVDYLRDMSDPVESAHVKKWFFPAQLVRGLLLSLIAYPVLDYLSGAAFFPRFAFFFLLLFLGTHIACAAPCSDNIEGGVYLKEKYLRKGTFFKFQTEMIIYSTLAASAASWLLF